MMHLLAIEWLKIKKYRTFWILTGFFIILLPVWNMGINDGILKLGGSGKDGINLLDNAYTFKQVWSNMGFWGSWFIMFITILVIIITTNEYTYKTNRQNLIDGWTRMQVLHAKWLFVILLATFCTVYVFIVGVIFGIANNDLANFPGDLTKLFYFFVLALNYCSFGLLLGYLFKRSGIATGMFFLYIMFLENILKGLGNRLTDSEIFNLLPLQASDELLPFQLAEMAKQLMQQKIIFSDSTYVFVSLGWIIIYYLISRIRLLKTDW